ncbi:7309_t:CDS:1, partial [Rhizophagus irregularis]
GETEKFPEIRPGKQMSLRCISPEGKSYRNKVVQTDHSGSVGDSHK